MPKKRKQDTDNMELKKLSLLFEVSNILDRSVDIRDSIAPVLEVIAKHTGTMRGVLTLLNRETGEISIELAYGLSKLEQKKGRYKLGEGITGKVVKTGKPVIVPRISEEPLFLNKTGARRKVDKKEISFICVPIKIGNEVIGALSVDQLFAEDIHVVTYQTILVAGCHGLDKRL